MPRSRGRSAGRAPCARGRRGQRPERAISIIAPCHLGDRANGGADRLAGGLLQRSGCSALELPRRVTVPSADWGAVQADLDEQGGALMPRLLGAGDCDAMTACYGPGPAFRSHVVMARHGFGRGEYRYFAYPLPPLVETLRTALYPHLAPIANRWHERMGIGVSFPRTMPHSSIGATPQARPGRHRCCCATGRGTSNCLHQDLYGEHVFPLQVAILLSEPGNDFTGGEFVLTEQRPRMQSALKSCRSARVTRWSLAVNQRPHRGVRGDYRVALRHGVSKVRSGHRHTLGIIFHDAR